MKQFISENVNGILGTTILHLILFIVLLVVQIGKIRDYNSEQILVEFDEEAIPIEDVITPVDYYASYTEVQNNQSSEGIRSLVTNISGEDVSAQDYEQQIMDELGIESLKPEMPAADLTNEFSLEEQKASPEKPPETINNRIVTDNTVVSYDLLNRWHRYIYIPAYKCKGGGTVTLNIEVNQQGAVNSATVIKGLSTNDQCLIDEAVNSALQAVFNSGPSLPARQQGMITYTFIPQ